MSLDDATERLNQGRFSLESDLFPRTVDPSIPPNVQNFLKALEASAARGDFAPPEKEEEEEEDDECDCEFAHANWDSRISPADAIEAIQKECVNPDKEVSLRQIVETLVNV